jgi:hypothetical protein
MHANDEAARAVLQGHPLKQWVEWYAANPMWPAIGIAAFALLFPCLLLPLMYRRERAC